ncbi:unnamed protein product [Albugo candida]|uniref:Non-canonical E2 ubiquitin-conjugating enzyme C-terminal domain-containing protein n=1 Tax=Albugo candida TaxID=65357 RepID=A0A024G9U7_9STRA|nr:unnamed protein product [Albugo candida]|eukprot:CCI43656.1 unnamed protein product [Albugo candida]
MLRTMEAALSISQCTNQMDTVPCVKNLTKRILPRLTNIFGFLTNRDGFQLSSGSILMDEKDLSDKEKFFRNILEPGRRYNIMSPERMRGEYGKLMYLLQDAADPGVQELLGISLHRKIKTRQSHSHKRQFHYMLQSLPLWRENLHDMFHLWHHTDQDLHSRTNAKYQLTDTGQAVHRVHPAPLLSRAMHVILHETQRRLGLESWVGSSVIHLGDQNVPNALMFIDTYTQIGYMLRPIVKSLNQLLEMTSQYRNRHQYINTTYGGIVQLQKKVLADFFRETFDGSGGESFFDAESCINSRLKSALELAL